MRYVTPAGPIALVGGAGLLGLAWLSTGCADACVDDGLLQQDCPAMSTDGASASQSASLSATDTASQTASQTASNSDSQGSGSMSASQSGTTTMASATDTNGSASGTGETDGLCPILDVDLSPQIPTVVLLIDQSGSMDAPFGPDTRWNTVRDALVTPMTGVVAQFESQIRFGLSLYTSFDGNQGGGICPVLTEAAPALNNFTPIETTFQGAVPQEDTPTGDAIVSVTAQLMNDPNPDDKVIVLATDGEPDTCAIPDPQFGQMEAVMAATDAFNQGIRTFIISVGNQVSQGHLQDMANAGTGVMAGDPDAPFYQANDAQQLTDAFNQIINGIRECTFTLDDNIQVNLADECTVQINMTDVPLDDPDGWRVVDTNEIELTGAACTSIQMGNVAVDMICGCDAVDD